MATEIFPGIVTEAGVALGKPLIMGTHLPAALVLGQLAAGFSEREICVEYGLRREQIGAALRFAAGPRQPAPVRVRLR